MKGLGNFIAGGEEGARAFTVEHFMYAATMAWDQQRQYQFIKEIPESIKDIAMGAIIEPLQWVGSKLPKFDVAADVEEYGTAAGRMGF